MLLSDYLYTSNVLKVRGVNLGGWGSRPPDFGQRGREILYLIMHRKYVRKWRLLRRNRIICLEVAVNGQFLPGKSIFFKLPEKIEFVL